MWRRAGAARRGGAGAGREVSVKVPDEVCGYGFITGAEHSPRSAGLC